MNYDYRKLKGKIKEVFDTQGAFAIAMKMSEATLTSKLSNASEWRQTQISRACKALGIMPGEIYDYFFAANVK